MLSPLNERHVLEHERRHLAAMAPEDTARRERFTWQIRRALRRMAELNARLCLPSIARRRHRDTAALSASPRDDARLGREKPV
jgi:hypothetical protein